MDTGVRIPVQSSNDQHEYTRATNGMSKMGHIVFRHIRPFLTKVISILSVSYGNKLR